MFTETYIEMAVNNKEIQGLWKPKKGDYYIAKGAKNIEIYIDGFAFLPQMYVPLSELYKWLPTLEDLFEIAKPIFSKTALELNYVVIGNKVEVLIGKCDSEGCGLDIEFTATSLETGLLRAIMVYKYNKSWNGKEWGEINGS